MFVLHSAFGPLFCRTRFFACSCCFVRFCFSFSLLSPGGALGAPDVGRLRRPVGLSCWVVVFVCVHGSPPVALSVPRMRDAFGVPSGFLLGRGLLLFVCPGRWVPSVCTGLAVVSRLSLPPVGDYRCVRFRCSTLRSPRMGDAFGVPWVFVLGRSVFFFFGFARQNSVQVCVLKDSYRKIYSDNVSV